MKRILTFIFAASIISTAAFTKNFFSQRYFEIKAGTEVGISNNLFSLNEIMKKDLVLDLKKIASDCPQNGFNIRADAEPSLAINLNIKDLHIGFSAGLESYESIEFGKDFFEFLGNGNTVGETMDFTFKNDTDVFAVSTTEVGFRMGRFKINVAPAMFLPILSIRGGGGSMTVRNDSNGELKVDMDLSMNVYSVSDLKKSGSTITFDEDKLMTTLGTGYGFDLGGGVAYDIDESLFVEATCRFPVIPGHLTHKSVIEGGFEYDMKLTDFENSDSSSKDTTVTNEETRLAINRPLKLNLFVNKNLLGTLFNARAGVGFGVRRPFCDVAVFYPEYYLGFGFNLADVFKIGVSTQYKNQIFIHQVATTLNVRFFQLDLGVSTQSSSFKRSMSFGGVGAFAYVTVGF